jgi:UMF1 family MFS transporter
MSNKRIKNGWAFYDWANSVYSLVIATAIFPIYFSSISPEILSLAGYDFESAALYSYSLAAAFIVVAILSPVLSGIADYSGNKKLFMQIFAYLGSASCLSLYFFNDSNIFFGLTMSALASIGFWGSLVFYNAFLPEIAKPEEQDALSAKGFSLGYIGSSLLLIFNLLMITFPESFGISDAGQASRISFLTVAIWWAGFAQITFRRLPRLPTNINNRKPKESGYLWRGFRELKKVALHVNQDSNLRKYLYAFFFFSTGVQTIILLASLFGNNELGMESGKLIATILIIQFVGIAGAQLFAFLSRKMGNLQSLKISIAIWAFICVLAFLLDKNDPMVEYKFYGVGALVGLVMGGIQAIGRSTYSKLLPETDSHASFFSFYDVTEKIAIVFGTVIYGYLIQITGDMKASALSLSIFFVIGFFQILRIKKTKNVY